MSHNTGIELSNLILCESKITKLQKELETLFKSDESLFTDVRKKQLELEYEGGKLQESFHRFLKAEGIPEQGSSIGLCNHFFQKGKTSLISLV